MRQTTSESMPRFINDFRILLRRYWCCLPLLVCVPAAGCCSTSPQMSKGFPGTLLYPLQQLIQKPPGSEELVRALRMFESHEHRWPQNEAELSNFLLSSGQSFKSEQFPDLQFVNRQDGDLEIRFHVGQREYRLNLGRDPADDHF